MERKRQGIVTERSVAAVRRFEETDSDVLARVFPWAVAVRPIQGGWKLFEDIDDALDECRLLGSLNPKRERRRG